MTYQSIYNYGTKSAQVMPPKQATRETPQMIKLRQLIALGHDPAAAFQAAIKAEGHAGRAPSNTPENVGKMGRPRNAASPDHLANIMAIMNETPITAYTVWTRTGIWKGAVRTTLAHAVLDGLITEIKGAGRVPNHYVKAGCDVAEMPAPKRGKTFEHDGVTYDSRRIAAAALGVDPSTLAYHMNRGTLHHMGKGQTTRPIVINGTTYRTRREAAIGEKVSLTTIGQMLHDGRARYAEEGK